MDKRFKHLTVELAHLLQLKSSVFLLEKLNNEENTSDVINLILSAHMSSLFNSMMNIAEEHEQIKNKVNNLITNMIVFIQKEDPIHNVEVLRGH